MSVMGSDETPSTGADRLNEALVAFTGCIGESLEDICSYSLTMGDSYVPFAPDEDDDCDDGDAECAQAWVRVMSVGAPGSDGWDNDCATVMRLDLEVGVLRCIEIPEDGEAPTGLDVMTAAMQAMTDMNAMYCAAMACEVWAAIDAGEWTPMGPLGGQYGGTWMFTVEV